MVKRWSYGVQCNQELGLLDKTFESGQWAIQECPVLRFNACQRWNHPELLQDGFRVCHGLSVVFRKGLIFNDFKTWNHSHLSMLLHCASVVFRKGLERGFRWQFCPKLRWAVPSCPKLSQVQQAQKRRLLLCPAVAYLPSRPQLEKVVSMEIEGHFWLRPYDAPWYKTFLNFVCEWLHSALFCLCQ